MNHLRQVAEVLSSYYSANPPSDDVLPDVARALAYCCLRQPSVAVRSSKKEPPFVIASQYVAFLHAEAARAKPYGARINTLLDVYEDQLRGLTVTGKKEARLMVPFTVAWSVLRARAGRTGPPPGDIVLALPHASTVLGGANNLNLADDAVRKSIDELCGAKSETTLPTTPEALQSRLAALRRGGSLASVQALWLSFLAEYDNPKSEHPLAAPDQRYQALSKFIHAARLTRNPGQSEEDDRFIEQLDAAALAKAPRPMPLPVLSVLLLNPVSPARRKEDTEVHDAKFLTTETIRVWEQSRGIPKDLDTYGAYMSRLGRAHRGRELINAWEELQSDTSCRELYRAETGDTNWPPTKTLNQNLAAMFTIGSVTAEYAQALWGQSLDPKSPFKPDLITANTALRFAAQLGDINVMNAIITHAQEQGLIADDITYTTLVMGLLHAKRPELVTATLEAMSKRGMEPSSHMTTLLVHDMARDGKQGGLLMAEEFIRLMRSRGVKIDSSAWTALAAGYFKGQWFQEGWLSLNRMRQAGQDLSTVQYNILLQHAASAWLRTAKSADATVPVITLFRQMIEHNVAPNADTYTVVLAQLQKSPNLDDLQTVLDDIDARNFKTNKGTLAQLIAASRQRVRRGVVY
ncbi:hypothetical protein Q8F55_006389 [Vanrija albida]|uniref:Pentacotripeptide-repeat region of PRORP domain-containing protein n=1 Tax=Vanrija albida TaxID=181172 RepID=A0ABR3PX22_9TREE